MRFVALLCLLVAHLNASPVSIAFVGDVNFTGRVGEIMHEKDFIWAFEPVKQALLEADYRVANLESPAGVGGKKYCKKRVYFKADPENISALSYAGFDMVSLANNHALDYGPDVLRQTMIELDQRDIKHIGIVKDNFSRNEATIVDINGLKVAFLAYCNACPAEFGPRSTTAGVSIGLSPWIKKQVKQARAKGADFVIAMPHWGSEYFAVDKNQRYTAKVMADAGVDVIIGSHPHVLQKIEYIDKTLVVWSLGNFLFPMRWQISMDSAIVKVNLQKGKRATYDILPVTLTSNRPVPADPHSETYKRVDYITLHGYQYNNVRTWPANGPWDEPKNS